MQDAVQATTYRFDFLKYRYFWLAVSIGFLAVGAVMYVMKGGFKYHIDFTGGAEVRVAYEQSLDIGKVRSAMASRGWEDAAIQSVGTSNKDFLITIPSLAADGEARIKADLSEGVAGNKATIASIQMVGAQAGKDTTQNAIIAVLVALLILLLYIAIRFEWRFGVGAIASLIHDILAVLVFLLLTGEPISVDVLAAVLSVLGYSLHDTIVIFSRIRDNMKSMQGGNEYDIANLSINQTLRRTLLTSFATMLSVIAILVLGGHTLRGLSAVLLVGIIVGTYSSIYIASPVMLAMKRKKSV
jgi:preprotein translocase subunit SecF